MDSTACSAVSQCGPQCGDDGSLRGVLQDGRNHDEAWSHLRLLLGSRGVAQPALAGLCFAPPPASPRIRCCHEQQMMVIRSPLRDFLALWSSHCQVKNRHHGDDSADPHYQKLLFSVARGGAAGAGEGLCESLARVWRGSLGRSKSRALTHVFSAAGSVRSSAQRQRKRIFDGRFAHECIGMRAACGHTPPSHTDHSRLTRRAALF